MTVEIVLLFSKLEREVRTKGFLHQNHAMSLGIAHRLERFECEQVIVQQYMYTAVSCCHIVCGEHLTDGACAFQTRQQPLNCSLCHQRYTDTENRQRREDTIDRPARQACPAFSRVPATAHCTSRGVCIRRTRLLLRSTDRKGEREREREINLTNERNKERGISRSSSFKIFIHHFDPSG